MINGVKKHAAVAIITAGIVLTTTGFNSAKPSDAPPPEPAPIVLHEATVIHALAAKARIVAPTGKIAKTSTEGDSNFWGHRDYVMTVKGDYILGIDTQDIDVSVSGNTIKVRMPQPKIVSLNLPYDQMTITEDKSPLRRELPEKELKALYTEATAEVRKDIAKDDVAQAKAERQMEQAVSGLLLKINGVESVQFEEAE
ncbi:DUF4230 domain-containing protein [Peribacillus butanolivorans]|uniref:DUF4230 domain-containing protein n=1 Tax=Peribacillus butanolivorans TaxID=421767 RepID=A0ABM6XN11_9BACI|nr:DUF4230 domain-containing protein [Peribacillus butanolivorans]AXN39827.1 DUF4230 domain-containing protein [Peribacillus butanolivorans]